jgi:hypothetical protein
MLASFPLLAFNQCMATEEIPDRPLKLCLHILAAGATEAAARLQRASLQGSLEAYRGAQIALLETPYLALGELSVPTPEDEAVTNLFFPEGLEKIRHLVGATPVRLTSELAGEMVDALGRFNLTRHSLCEGARAELFLRRHLGKDVVTAYWPAGEEMASLDAVDLRIIQAQLRREGFGSEDGALEPVTGQVQEEMLGVDDAMERALHLPDRLPASMIDSVQLQPVNVPVALMSQIFYIPPLDLDIDLSTLEPAEQAEAVAEIVQHGVRSRVYLVDAFLPESRVGVGIIEERTSYPGLQEPGTVFGPLGLGRFRRHPQSGLRRGMVIENEIEVLTADGESVPGHRMEFYSEVRMVASTRVWAQIMARGAVNLVDRQKDYMERHHQLDPRSIWSPERNEVIDPPWRGRNGRVAA